MPALKQEEMKYKAFISYSHQDKKWGDWLHRKLETYRVPSRLTRHDRDNNIPRRLFPVFRDREELPTSSDLGSSIQDALEASQTLIVICSPRSANSQWVNEEILHFKRLGKSEHVFCLIIDGEPNASDKPEEKNNECFPTALRYRLATDGTLSSERAEPIAADARPGKDGKSDSALKLIAGVLGVGYDELKRRDLQRQIRRLIGFSVAATLLLSLTIGLATFALYSRADAVRQRQLANEQFVRAEKNFQQARATVDRFFVNVSEEELFATHGLQPLQERLLTDALNYYNDFLEQHSDDPALLFETSQTEQKIGDITSLIGNRQQALSHYQNALVTLESLIAKNGSTNELQNKLAECLEGMAVVHWELENPKKALELLSRARKILRVVINEQPANTDAIETWKSIIRNIGPFQRQAGLKKEAQTTYQQAWNYWEQNQGRRARKIGVTIAVNDPSQLKTTLLITSVLPASAAHAAGLVPGDLIKEINGSPVNGSTNLKNTAASLSAGDKLKLTIKRDGNSFAKTLTLQNHVDLFAAIVAMNAGVLTQEDFGDLDTALLWYERAETISENLLVFAAAEGTSTESTTLNTTKHLLSSIHIYLGNLYFSRQEYKKAIDHQSRSYDLIGFLADHNPTVTQYQQSLAVTASNLAAITNHIEPKTNTFDLHQRSAQAMRRLTSNHPQIETYSFQLARIYNNSAIYLANRNQLREATTQYRQAEELLIKLYSQNNTPNLAIQLANTRRNLGLALINLKQLEAAQVVYLDSANLLLDLLANAETSHHSNCRNVLSEIYTQLAKVATLQEDQEETKRYQSLILEHQKKEVAHLEQLFLRDHANRDIRKKLTTTLNNHGTTLIDLNILKARQPFLRIIDIYRKGAQIDQLTAFDKGMIARGHGNLAWLELLSKNYSASISRCRSALEHDNAQEWIHLNLASAYLCDGQFDMAKQIYSRLMRESDNPKVFLKSIEKEFTNLKTKGITHPDMKKILTALAS